MSLRSLEFRAMGCQMLAAIDSPESLTEIDKVPAWFEEWEQCLSRFRLDSELNSVNRQAGIPTGVSQIFAEVFEAAVDAERWSNGLVTPVLLNALVQAGYDRSFELIQSSDGIDSMSVATIEPKLDEVSWDAFNRTICLPPDMQLDFGGVAKGWSALQAANRLGKYAPALIDAGGDISISADRLDGKPWLVGIADPFRPSENLEILSLGRCGVATSGRDKRTWMRNGRRFHHIIDPATGLPADSDVLTATIIAPTVVEAECAAKTILISGSESGLSLLEANPQFAGLLVLENGNRLYSRAMKDHLSS